MQLGMNGAQPNTLAAALAKEQNRHMGQGDVQSCHTIQDGNTIAVRHLYAARRDFDVNAALGRMEHSHWSEAAALDGDRSVRAVVIRENPGAQFQAARSPLNEAPVLSQG
jgi:hypothetical protein